MSKSDREVMVVKLNQDIYGAYIVIELIKMASIEPESIQRMK